MKFSIGDKVRYTQQFLSNISSENKKYSKENVGIVIENRPFWPGDECIAVKWKFNSSPPRIRVHPNNLELVIEPVKELICGICHKTYAPMFIENKCNGFYICYKCNN